MNIDNFKVLIKNLPVRQQSFTTKRTTWKPAEEKIDWLGALNDKLFEKQETLNISRQDIFNTNYSLRELILKTIYWGYTAGMRGNHFVEILTKITSIEEALNILKNKNELTDQDFIAFSEAMENIPGIGLSTYSKLLYFFNIKFDGNPCLILDQRLIDVFNSNFYEEYMPLGKIKDYKREEAYLPYLSLTNKISKNLETKGENLEQFLFIFGNNLKFEKPEISEMWDGYCPESFFKGKKVRMRLNKYDFYESEETRLQICVLRGVQAIILKSRGEGKFRTTPTYGDEIENGEMLSPQNVKRPPFNSPTEMFSDSNEIENYIRAVKE